MNDVRSQQLLRRPLFFTGLLAVTVAIAPWFSGGQEMVARVITAVVLLLALLLLYRQPQLARLSWQSPIVILSFVLVIWGTLSLLWSINAYHSILWLMGLGMAIITFGLTYRLVTIPGGRWWLQRIYLGVASLFSLYGFWVFYTSGYNRLTSSLYWANPAAGFLLPAVIVCLNEMGLSVRKKWWAWPLGLLIETAFWTTQSRAAVVVLIVGLLALIALQRRSKGYFIRLGVALMTSFLLSTLCVQLWHSAHPQASVVTLGSRFVEAAQGESSSGSDRIYYLTSAAKILRDHPVLGTGAGTFTDAHPKYQERVISASSDAHNWYIQTLSELGIVGGLLLVVLMILLLRGVLRGFKSQPELLPWAVGALALVLHLGLDIDGQYPALLALGSFLLALVWTSAGQVRNGRSSFVPIIALIIAVGVAASANTSQIAASLGAAAQANGDYAGAAVYFKQAHQSLVFDPSVLNAEGINYYSLAITKQDVRANFALALDAAHAAQKLAPLEAQNYQLEGRVYLAQYKLKYAQVAFEHALMLDPYNQPSYAQDLAVVLRDTGNLQRAIKVTSATLAAVINLWHYQQYLHSEMLNDAAAAQDAKNAEAVQRSLSTN
jgi:O-antigen ligase